MTASRPIFVPFFLRKDMRKFSEDRRCDRCKRKYVQFVPQLAREYHLCPDCDGELQEFVNNNRKGIWQ